MHTIKDRMQNYSNITKYDNVMYSQEKKESGKQELRMAQINDKYKR